MPREIPNCSTCHKPMPLDREGAYCCEDCKNSAHKKVLCDLLMKQGIAGRSDEDAVAHTCLLTDLAVELGAQGCPCLCPCLVPSS